MNFKTMIRVEKFSNGKVRIDRESYPSENRVYIDRSCNISATGWYEFISKKTINNIVYIKVGKRLDCDEWLGTYHNLPESEMVILYRNESYFVSKVMYYTFEEYLGCAGKSEGIEFDDAVKFMNDENNVKTKKGNYLSFISPSREDFEKIME